MDLHFLGEHKLNSPPSNSNTVYIQNSTRNSFEGSEFINNDNFWTVDPLLLSDKYILKSEYDSKDISESQTINTTNKSDNRNCSVKSLDYCVNEDEISCSLSYDGEEPRDDSYQTAKEYVRKLPLHFIDSKDWQLYLEYTAFRDSSIVPGSKIGNGIFPKYSKNKSKKVQRLLNSLHNLYHEYSGLCDEYELLKKSHLNKMNSFGSVWSEGHSEFTKESKQSFGNFKSNKKKRPYPTYIPEANIIKRFDHLKMEKSSCMDAICQTHPVLEWSDLSDPQLSAIIKVSETANNARGTKGSNAMGNNNRRTSTSFQPEFSAVIKSKRTKMYDHLMRQNFLGLQSIDVVEELLMSRPTLVHKMNIISNSGPGEIQEGDNHHDLVSHPNFIFNSIATAFRCATSKAATNSSETPLNLINLPILLDLMIPKVQTKVHQIFEECSFLNNPLEVVAELRFYNYNKNSTVEYFNGTKQLRDSIKEFISNSLDSRCRMTIMDCLHRNYKNDLFNSICFTCRKDLSSIKEEDIEFVNNFYDSGNRSNSVATSASNAEKAKVEMKSKITDIEPGIFDNTVQDSFSQTANVNVQLYPDRIQTFAESIQQNIIYVKKSIKESKIQMSHLKKQVSSLIKALKNNIDLIMSMSSKQFMTDQHRGRIMLLVNQVEELKLKLKDEETKRRSVYNLMQEQMGNVRVYCRCRDIAHNDNILEIHGNESIILPILSQERFDFDNVFPSIMKQIEIYEEFKPLVMSFIDGFNVCFITYGSEASGKTYTLIGGDISSPEEHGIMQRALNTVLTEQKLRNRDWEYKITACLIEIYNDNCIDILSGENGLQLYVDCGMESVYQKLKSVPITNESDVDVLLHLCRSKRKVARTALNPASSRSHLITLIRLQGKSKIHGENIRSFMCLCDLAGFEDIIKAETQSNKTLSKEAGYINRSLTAFNRVFVSLRRQDPNTVCYRDTKLTHLLKPFLTNSGKCALIITIRTDRRSLSSTQNTLRFGRETRGVSLGKARRQISNN